MCRMKTPKIPPSPTYATAPNPTEPSPTFDINEKTYDLYDKATVRAKRRAARGLRTDLGFNETEARLSDGGPAPMSLIIPFYKP